MSTSKSSASSSFGYLPLVPRARTVRAILLGLALGVVSGLLAFGCVVAA